MSATVAFMIGVTVGGILVLALGWIFRRREQQIAADLLASAEARQIEQFNKSADELRGSFENLARQALSANNEDFLTLAKTRLEQQTTNHNEQLDSRRKLIDQQFESLTKRLSEMSSGFRTLEEQRREQHGALKNQIEQASKVTHDLQATTSALREALASPTQRGQWGERIAEDVLQLAGFVKGVSYFRQETIDGGERPDFTFPLPNNQRVHMDVKFPASEYLRLLEASDPTTAAAHRTQFLRDIRTRVREVTQREYIDPAAGTVDYVLVFIPNEQIYSFMHEHDPSLLDDALRQKVVLCSPLTLYAMLALMRRVAEQYRLQESSREILTLLASFRKQWEKYSDAVDLLGKAMETLNKRFGELTTTRTRQLERQMDKIDALQRETGSDDFSLEFETTTND